MLTGTPARTQSSWNSDYVSCITAMQWGTFQSSSGNSAGQIHSMVKQKYYRLYKRPWLTIINNKAFGWIQSRNERV